MDELAHLPQQKTSPILARFYHWVKQSTRHASSHVMNKIPEPVAKINDKGKTDATPRSL